MAYTAYVDGLFSAGAAAVVEDETKPFGTINAALTAITATRGANVTQRWRVVVRPGIYNEGGATITSLPNVDIYGAGPSTQITTTFAFTAGPCTIANMTVSVPSGSNVTVSSAVRLLNSTWAFTPSTSAVGNAFQLTSPTPSLNMDGVTFSIIPTVVPPTFATALAGVASTATTISSTFLANNVTGTIIGLGASIVSITALGGTSTVDMRDCIFGLTIYDTATAPIAIYGGNNIVQAATYDFNWNITGCQHTVTNSTLGGATAGSYYALNMTPATANPFTPTTSTRCIVSQCVFDYIGYTNTATIYSASQTLSTTTNFVQMLDDTWSGTTVHTLYFPSSHPTTPQLILQFILVPVV